MSNNYTTDQPQVGDGAVFASDDIGGVHHPAIKIEYGDEDSATYVSATNPLPITPGTGVTFELGAGTATIGKLAANDGVDIGNVDVASLPAAQIGQKTIASSLSIVPASNIPDATYIGDIKFAESLPAGSSNIGDVDIASLPSGNLGQRAMSASLSIVPASDITDATYIGDVKFAEPLPSGNNNIGDVDVASLPALPAGTNNIGDVDVASLPSGNLGQQAMAASLSVVPASNITDATYIGDIKFGEPLPAGTNAIGKLAANDGVDIGDVDVTSMPATAAESGALPSVFVVVAGDDGTDTHPLQLDTSGNLKVNVAAGGGSGGTSMTDDAAFTTGSTSVTPAAGIYQSTPDTVDDNDAGAVRMTQRRALYVSHETPNGDSMVDDSNDALKVNIVAGGGSGGTSMTDDAAFTSGSTGITPAGGVYQSSPDTVNDNDGGALRMTQQRALYVSHETPNGDSMVDDTNDALKVNIVAGAGSGGTAMTDDAAFTPASTSITPAGGMFNDTTPDSVDEGDGGVLRMSSRRELYVQVRDAAGNERGLNVDASGNIGVTDAGSSVTVDTTGTGGLEVVQLTAGDLNMTEANSAAIAASLDVVDDWDETNRCAVNLISTQTGVAGGSGADAANVLRVSLATDVALPAGDNNIGNVDLASAIPAGSNNIGDVDMASLPAANLGQQLMAASLSVVPASNITDATYIGDIKFGEPLPAGTNAIGKLAANDGVDIGDVDVTSMPATAAESAALPSVFVVVAGDDGTDTHPLQTDSSGRLIVSVDSENVDLATETTLASCESYLYYIDSQTYNMDGNITSIESYLGVLYQVAAVDDAGFSPGSDYVTMIGGFVDEASPATNYLDEGDVGAIRMTSRRELLISLRDAAGNERGVNVDANNCIGVAGAAAEDAAVAGNPVLVGGRFDSSERTVEDGDAATLALSAQGWALIGQQSGYLFDGATRCQIKRKSGLCASGTTAILSAVSGKKFRILAFAVIATANTANSFYLSTSTDTDVLGDSSNPIPLAMDADGDNVAGLILPWNPGGWTETSTGNEALNLTLAAAYDVVYCITYIEVA